MRLKKKCAIIISIIILCFLFIGIRKTFAASADRFYMKGRYTDENTMEVKVYLDTEHADNFRGVLSYDNELVLKEIRTNLENTAYKPNIETEGEKSYKGAKGLSFGYAVDTDHAISGTTTIITLMYDISNCEEGESYSISWDTDNLAGSGDNTYVSYNQEHRDVQAEGFVFTIADDDGSDEDEQKKKEQEEASRKAEEEARKKAEEEARKKAEEEEAKRKAEEEANKQKEEFSATISYDVTTPTSGRVTAVITANKKLKELAGWTLSPDGNVLTKIYTANKKETVKIEDENGNTQNIEVKIENIVDTSGDNKNNTANNSTKNNTAKNNTSKNNSSNQANKNYPQTGSSTTIIIGVAIAFIVLMGVVAFIKARNLKFSK